MIDRANKANAKSFRNLQRTLHDPRSSGAKRRLLAYSSCLDTPSALVLDTNILLSSLSMLTNLVLDFISVIQVLASFKTQAPTRMTTPLPSLTPRTFEHVHPYSIRLKFLGRSFCVCTFISL